MTDQTCPKCGKPVRPGAQFCGNCGANIPGNDPAKPSAGAMPSQAGTPPAQSPASVCPHCGKPVRAEAKFCPNCGQTISRGAAQPSPRVTPSGTPPPTIGQPARPLPVGTPPSVSPPPAAQVKPAGKEAQTELPVLPGLPVPPIPPSPSTGSKGKGFFRKYWIFIVLLVILLALLGFTIYEFQKIDPFKWFDKGTSEVTKKPTETKKANATEKSDVTETTPAILTVTSTPVITSTGNVVPLLPTITVTQTPVLTPTLDSLAVFTMDDFSGVLADKWALWGPSVPIINNGELQLNHKYAGVTTKGSITLVPGLTIQFKAHGTETAPNRLIVFDWDAGDILRQAVDKAGLLNVEIGNGFSKLLVNSSAGCQLVSNTNIHTYEITIGAGEVILSMDGTKCSVQVVLPPVIGHISFSGLGWVDDVQVIRP